MRPNERSSWRPSRSIRLSNSPWPPRALRIRADAIKSDDAQAPAKKCYIVLTVALSVLLAGGFLWADAQANRAMQTEDGTVLQSLVRQLAGKSVYIIDGKYYDQGKIDALASSLAAEQANFRAAAFQLKDDIKDAYALCDSNIDAFLDWYFSIATNGSVRSDISADGAQQALEKRFYALVTSDEDEKITQKVRDYLRAASDLEAKIDDGYREAEVRGENYAELPDWFVESKEFSDATALNVYRQQAENALDAARDEGILDALAKGKTLLECQFEGSVYGKEPFTKWVDATRGIAGDSNPLSDILHYASDVFDQKNRDSYRADVEARLAECKMQALAFVAQNTALG